MAVEYLSPLIGYAYENREGEWSITKYILPLLKDESAFIRGFATVVFFIVTKEISMQEINQYLLPCLEDSSIREEAVRYLAIWIEKQEYISQEWIVEFLLPSVRKKQDLSRTLLEASPSTFKALFFQWRKNGGVRAEDLDILVDFLINAEHDDQRWRPEKYSIKVFITDEYHLSILLNNKPYFSSLFLLKPEEIKVLKKAIYSKIELKELVTEIYEPLIKQNLIENIERNLIQNISIQNNESKEEQRNYSKNNLLQKIEEKNLSFKKNCEEALQSFKNNQFDESLFFCIAALNSDQTHNPEAVQYLLATMKKQRSSLPYAYHNDSITCLLPLDDKGTILSCSAGSSTVWNMKTENQLSSPYESLPSITAAIYLSETTYLLAHYHQKDKESTVTVWNIEQKNEPIKILKFGDQAIKNLYRISSNIFASYDGEKLTFSNLEKSLKTISLKDKDIIAIDVFSSEVLSMINKSNELFYLDIQSEGIKQITTLKDNKITVFKFMDDNTILLAHEGGKLQSYHIETKQYQIFKETSYRKSSVTHIALINKTHFVTGDNNGSVKLWNKDSKETCLQTFDCDSAVTVLTVTAQNKILIGCEDGSIHYWSPSLNFILPQANFDFIPYESLKLTNDKVGFNKSLGGGSFALVYKGTLQKGNEEINVAIKVEKSKDDNAKKRVEQEAQQLTVVNECPNVIGLHGVTQNEEGQLMLVMELASHGSLVDLFKNWDKISWQMKRNYMIDILYGVLCLHANQIHHRDIKPGNILINGNKVKLGDLGLAYRDLNKTWTRGAAGSLNYIEPWLLFDKTGRLKYTKKSDIYSLAIVLWEMLHLVHELPWSKLTTDNDFEQTLVKDNQKLPTDKLANIKLKNGKLLKDEILSFCWDKNRNARPDIRELFEVFFSAEEEFLKLDNPLDSDKKINVEEEIIKIEAIEGFSVFSCQESDKSDNNKNKKEIDKEEFLEIDLEFNIDIQKTENLFNPSKNNKSLFFGSKDDNFELSLKSLGNRSWKDVKKLIHQDIKLTHSLQKGVIRIDSPRIFDNECEIDVPHDGDCLFWSAVLAYLLPVIFNNEAFLNRFNQLFSDQVDTFFGEQEKPGYLRIQKLLKIYVNAIDQEDKKREKIFYDEEFNYLVRVLFRGRVVAYLEDNKEKYRAFSSQNKSEKSLEEHLNNMYKIRTWGDQLEIVGIHQFLSCNIHTVTTFNEIIKNEAESFSNEIMTLVHTGNHYHYRINKLVLFNLKLLLVNNHSTESTLPSQEEIQLNYAKDLNEKEKVISGSFEKEKFNDKESYSSDENEIIMDNNDVEFEDTIDEDFKDTERQTSEDFKNLIKKALEQQYVFKLKRHDKNKLTIECTKATGDQKEQDNMLVQLTNQLSEELKNGGITSNNSKLEFSEDSHTLTIISEPESLDSIAKLLKDASGHTLKSIQSLLFNSSKNSLRDLREEEIEEIIEKEEGVNCFIS